MQKSSKELSKMQKSPELQPFPLPSAEGIHQNRLPCKSASRFWAKMKSATTLQKRKPLLKSATSFHFWSALFVLVSSFYFCPECKYCRFCIILGRLSLLVGSFHFWSALLIFAQNDILADFAFWVALFTFGQLFSLLPTSFHFCPKSRNSKKSCFW